MGDKLKISAAADFARETRVVALPRPQGGRVLVVEVGAVPVLDLIAALDGIPTAQTPKAVTRTWEEVKAELQAAAEPSRRVAALGIIAPEFTFTAREDGKAFWGDVHPENQAFIIDQITALSGLTGEAAEKAETFPEGSGGQERAEGR